MYAIANGDYPNDIDNQALNIYDSDEIGNLIKDVKEGITNINWTVYGKISSINKASGNINYTYDAAGKRISKTVGGKTDWYVRDATGNVMSIYTVGDNNVNSGHITQNEIDIYGSSRLGVINVQKDLTLSNSSLKLGNLGTGYWDVFAKGRKSYELTNHLGNVLVTVSDKKISIDNGTYDANGNKTANNLDGVIDYYVADVVSANDYYPFGMIMPGRQLSNGVYRYGFNGKERDKDISNWDYDFGARIYDGRNARWLSIDSKSNELPFYSPYIFVNNNPLRYTDPDGAFLLDVHQIITKNALLKIFIIFLDGNPTVHTNSSIAANKWNDFQDGIRGWGTIFSGGITSPDWYDADNKEYHFDQKNYDGIILNFEQIKEKTANILTNYRNGVFNAKDAGIVVGKMLHAVEDFYSHSNYVELYTQMFGKQEDLNSIPTLKEVLADKKYEKFAELLKSNLKTGTYPGKGKGSHKEMNHDVGAGSNYTSIVPETKGKKVTYETKAAEAVATKAATEYLNDFKASAESQKENTSTNQ